MTLLFSMVSVNWVMLRFTPKWFNAVVIKDILKLMKALFTSRMNHIVYSPWCRDCTTKPTTFEQGCYHRSSFEIFPVFLVHKDHSNFTFTKNICWDNCYQMYRLSQPKLKVVAIERNYNVDTTRTGVGQNLNWMLWIKTPLT